MLKVVTLKRVYVNDTPKDSDIPYVYKKGKFEGQHFQRVTAKFEETDEEVYATNTLPGTRPTEMVVGEKYLLALEEQDGFKNFRFPTKAEEQVYNELVSQPSVA